MPNWTDEDGTDWFNKIECKRCLERFDVFKGEVPSHRCGGYYRSESSYGEYHYPVLVREYTVYEKKLIRIREEAAGITESKKKDMPKLKKDNYQTLITHLRDFEKLLKTSRLSTDEISDIIDRLSWLEQLASDKESDDS